MFFDPATQFVNHEMQHRLQTSHCLLGKERIHSCATKAMVPMVHSPESRSVESKLVNEKLVLVSRLVLGIELIVIVGVVYVELIRTDPNNWAYR